MKLSRTEAKIPLVTLELTRPGQKDVTNDILTHGITVYKTTEVELKITPAIATHLPVGTQSKLENQLDNPQIRPNLHTVLWVFRPDNYYKPLTWEELTQTVDATELSVITANIAEHTKRRKTNFGGIHLGYATPHSELSDGKTFQTKGSLATVSHPHSYLQRINTENTFWLDTDAHLEETEENAPTLAKISDLAGLAAQQLFAQEINEVLIEKFGAVEKTDQSGPFNRKLYQFETISGSIEEQLKVAIQAGEMLRQTVAKNWVEKTQNLSENPIIKELFYSKLFVNPELATEDFFELIQPYILQFAIPCCLVAMHDNQVSLIPFTAGNSTLETFFSYTIKRLGYDSKHYFKK